MQEEIGKLRSLEDSEKAELKKEKDLLQEQLSLKTAEVESLLLAQSQLVAQAKQDAVAMFKNSETFKELNDTAAAAKVEEFKRSSELGRIFLEVMTQVRSCGFTEGIECLKTKGPDFALESLTEEQRALYDLEASSQIDALIAKYNICTAFDKDEAADSPPHPSNASAPDEHSNS